MLRFFVVFLRVPYEQTVFSVLQLVYVWPSKENVFRVGLCL